MTHRHLAAALAAALMILSSLSAQALELMRWERLPLAVPLVVGQERVIFIDRNVKVGMDRALSGKLRVQSAGGAVYLLALQEIPPSRLQLQVAETGEIVLVDIAAAPGEQALEPVRILLGDQTEQDGPNGSKGGEGGEGEGAQHPPRTPVPVALTRYAAQSLYAPLRTVEALPGVRRVPVKLKDELPTLLPTAPVVSRAVAAWRLDDFWVTAMQLSNRGQHPIDLDPRQLQGQFYAATFQHTTLGPARTAEDTSMLYLVTRGGGLESAVLPPLPVRATSQGASADEK